MILIAGRMALAVFAAGIFQILSVSTFMGPIRFEWPFYLAFVYAAREARAYPSGIVFLAAALVFDAMDNQFAGTLSHILAFILVRRVKRLADPTQVPTVFVLGMLAASVDRLFFAFLVGLQAGGMSHVLSFLFNPAYILTVLLLPLGFLRARS